MEEEIKKEETQTVSEDTAVEAETATTEKASDDKNFMNGIVDILKKNMKVVGIAAGALVLLIIIIAIASSGSGSVNNYGLYFKDGQLVYSTLKEDKQQEVTSKLFSDISSDYSMVVNMTKISSDGKTIFFPDKLSSYSSVNLYYAPLGKKNAEAEKIDSNVVRYSVSEDAKTVTYLTAEGALYQSDLKEKEKLASDVKRFYVTEDGKKVIFLTKENTLYEQIIGKDKEKIDSEVTSVEYVVNDLSTVYYEKNYEALYVKETGEEKIKIDSGVADVLRWPTGDMGIYYLDNEDNLYVKNGDEDKVKIDSEVYRVTRIYSTGEIFYLKRNKVEMIEYLKDSKKATDDKMTYSDADYYNKLIRDEIRDEFEDWSFDRYAVYYFDGKESICLSENCVDRSSIVYSFEKPVIAFAEGDYDFDTVDIANIKLTSYPSSIVEGYYYEFEEELEESATLAISVGKNVTVTELENVYSARINDAGTEAFAVVEEDEEYNLYNIAIGGSKVGKVKEYDTDIYRYVEGFVSDDWFAYYKEANDDFGDLYVNGERVAYEVKMEKLEYISAYETLLYYTDWSNSSYSGTLNAFNGKKSEKVADEVNGYDVFYSEDDTTVLLKNDLSGSEYTLVVYDGKKCTKVSDEVSTAEFTAEGDILYIYDFSWNSYSGDLYLYDGGKEAVKLDEEVSAIYTYSGGRYMSCN